MLSLISFSIQWKIFPGNGTGWKINYASVHKLYLDSQSNRKLSLDSLISIQFMLVRIFDLNAMSHFKYFRVVRKIAKQNGENNEKWFFRYKSSLFIPFWLSHSVFNSRNVISFGSFSMCGIALTVIITVLCLPLFYRGICLRFIEETFTIFRVHHSRNSAIHLI